MAPVDVVSHWASKLPKAQEWFDWLIENGPKGDCRCTGFGPFPNLQMGRRDDWGKEGTSLWEYIIQLDLFLGIAGSITYMAGLREFMKEGTLNYIMTHLYDAITDCVPGVATVILLGIEAAEEVLAVHDLQRLLALSLALTAYARNFPCRYTFTLMDHGFAGHSLSPNFARLPFLLDMVPDLLECHSGAPKVFVYELDRSWSPKTPLGCTRGLAATEVWVHRQLLKSNCRAKTTEEADLFYVPLYARCLYAEKHKTLEKGYSWEHPFTNATEWYFKLLGELSFFRSRPQDHVFLFAEEHWPVPHDVFASGGLLGRSLILSPEARPLECSMELLERTQMACVHLAPRNTGLVVIPSFVESWRATQIKQFNRPLAQRSVLASFMGLGVSKGYSLTENFRGLLRVLTDLPGFLVGNYSENYWEVMGSSLFCLVPKGVGTWSHRLYEAMLAGCIPVILSDHMQLPFPELNWKSFSVRWPMRNVDAVNLPGYLRWLSGHYVVESMKHNVDLHSCWFDYHSERQDCSPLLGITRRLVDRGAKQSPEGFWGPHCRACAADNIVV